VIAQIRAWLDHDVPIVPVAINVSPTQLERTDFAQVVSQLSAKHGVDPRWLRFEITESAMMNEPDKFIRILTALRALGSQVLIDDFGTGYSSLSYLNQLPLDTLKIDRAFVRDLGNASSRTQLIHSVIDLAKKLPSETIAEGVETPEQAALLREYGCDYAQGYLYGRPVGARPCRALLRELKRVRPLTETVMVRAIATADRATQTAVLRTGGRPAHALEPPASIGGGAMDQLPHRAFRFRRSVHPPGTPNSLDNPFSGLCVADPVSTHIVNSGGRPKLKPSCRCTCYSLPFTTAHCLGLLRAHSDRPCGLYPDGDRTAVCGCGDAQARAIAHHRSSLRLVRPLIGPVDLGLRCLR